MKCKDESHIRNQEKLKETDKLYMQLYKDYGADIITNSKNKSFKLLLLPQYSFDSKIIKSIDYEKIILFAFYSFGSYLFDEFRNLGGDKVYVYAKKIFNEIIGYYNDENVVENFEIIEFIPPFKNYPALDYSELNIDYLIAYPTQVHIKDREIYINLLHNMVNILKIIPSNKSYFWC